MEWEGSRAPEHKFLAPGEALSLGEGGRISGYASLFGMADQGGDIVQRGAYRASIAARGEGGVKMLWQHDPAQPIGVWEVMREDAKGLWVEGYLLPEVTKGREAMALIAAGAVDGLSIGYRVKRASKDGQGRRLLHEVELWEVSLVTFPMQAEARLSAKSGGLWQGIGELAREIAMARIAWRQGFTAGERA